MVWFGLVWSGLIGFVLLGGWVGAQTPIDIVRVFFFFFRIRLIERQNIVAEFTEPYNFTHS